MDELSSVTDNSRNKSRSLVNSVSVLKCVNCTGSHSLSQCEEFLFTSHFTSKCQINHDVCIVVTMHHCRRMHHSLLYLAEGEISNININQAPGAQTLFPLSEGLIANVQTAWTEVPRTFNVRLATAWIDLYIAKGRCTKVRALLDQALTLSFISESLY